MYSNGWMMYRYGFPILLAFSETKSTSCYFWFDSFLPSFLFHWLDPIIFHRNVIYFLSVTKGREFSFPVTIEPAHLTLRSFQALCWIQLS